jgi:hypothetical protein
MEVISQFHAPATSTPGKEPQYPLNIQRKRDIHVQSNKTGIYENSVINMGTKSYNKMPGYIKKWAIISSLRNS